MVYAANNYEAVRLQLEEACKIVTVSQAKFKFQIKKIFTNRNLYQKSSSVTKEQRTNSENLFLEFHKSKSPYELCRYLLGTFVLPLTSR